MCHDPHTLADGTVVACRKCELCRYNRVKDWAGRNIAQSKVSAASFACTLTYGPELDAYPDGHSGGYGMPIPGRSDHVRMAVLTYSDVQKFLKYLRGHLGYACDFFVTGERGSIKERAHWHIILHFRDKVPSHEVNRRFSDRHVNDEGLLFKHEVCKAWPHGFMMWKPATFHDVFYNCKYILKDEDDEDAQRKPNMSKIPPLGAEYFFRLADEYVDHHLAPQTLLYRFAEVKKDDGSPLEFMLKGRTAEMYLERYIARWKEVHGGKPRPKSELVDLFEEYGKIVTDEARMLLRQQFPKGESRAAIPTGEQIKAMAEEARAELEQLRRDMAEVDRDDWRLRWINEGSNEQEKQRRREVVQLERVDEREQHEQEFIRFVLWKAKFGWHFVTGKGWVCSSPGSGAAGSENFIQWRRKYQAAEVAGEQRERRKPVLGRVGQWNWQYGKSAKKSG